MGKPVMLAASMREAELLFETRRRVAELAEATQRETERGQRLEIACRDLVPEARLQAAMVIKANATDLKLLSSKVQAALMHLRARTYTRDEIHRLVRAAPPRPEAASNHRRGSDHHHHHHHHQPSIEQPIGEKLRTWMDETSARLESLEDLARSLDARCAEIDARCAEIDQRHSFEDRAAASGTRRRRKSERKIRSAEKRNDAVIDVLLFREHDLPREDALEEEEPSQARGELQKLPRRQEEVEEPTRETEPPNHDQQQQEEGQSHGPRQVVAPEQEHHEPPPQQEHLVRQQDPEFEHERAASRQQEEVAPSSRREEKEPPSSDKGPRRRLEEEEEHTDDVSYETSTTSNARLELLAQKKLLEAVTTQVGTIATTVESLAAKASRTNSTTLYLKELDQRVRALANQVVQLVGSEAKRTARLEGRVEAIGNKCEEAIEDARQLRQETSRRQQQDQLRLDDLQLAFEKPATGSRDDAQIKELWAALVDQKRNFDAERETLVAELKRHQRLYRDMVGEYSSILRACDDAGDSPRRRPLPPFHPKRDGLAKPGRRLTGATLLENLRLKTQDPLLSS